MLGQSVPNWSKFVDADEAWLEHIVGIGKTLRFGAARGDHRCHHSVQIFGWDTARLSGEISNVPTINIASSISVID